MRLLLLALVAFGLVLPGGAGAVTLVTPDGEVAQPWQRWADRARVPTFDGTVTVHYGRVYNVCDEGACAADHDVWIERGDYPVTGRDARETRATLYHELEHLYDADRMTDAERIACTRLVGRDGEPWFGVFDAPGEQCAEGYAFCALPSRWLSWQRVDTETRGYAPTVGYYSGGDWGSPAYGYTPTRAQFGRMCAFFRRTGGWYMVPA